MCILIQIHSLQHRYFQLPFIPEETFHQEFIGQSYYKQYAFEKLTLCLFLKSKTYILCMWKRKESQIVYFEEHMTQYDYLD